MLLSDARAVRLSVSPGSAPFRVMTQLLIDVFSKALLVQSLPVLVFFREITNCSANPSQSSHLHYLSSELLRGGVDTWRCRFAPMSTETCVVVSDTTLLRALWASGYKSQSE